MMYVRYPLSLRNVEDLLHEGFVRPTWQGPPGGSMASV